MGYLEINIRGQWGYMCSMQSMATAYAACQKLGYMDGRYLQNVPDELGEPDALFAWISELRCTGNEEDLVDCGHGPWQRQFCDGTPLALECGELHVLCLIQRLIIDLVSHSFLPHICLTDGMKVDDKFHQIYGNDI